MFYFIIVSTSSYMSVLFLDYSIVANSTRYFRILYLLFMDLLNGVYKLTTTNT